MMNELFEDALMIMFYEQELRRAELSCAVGALMLLDIAASILYTKPNCPGSWHDSQIAQDLYPLLISTDTNPDQMGIIADSAFPRTAGMANLFFSPYKDDELLRIQRREGMAAYLNATDYSRRVSFVRQASCRVGDEGIPRHVRQV